MWMINFLELIAGLQLESMCHSVDTCVCFFRDMEGLILRHEHKWQSLWNLENGLRCFIVNQSSGENPCIKMYK